MNFWIVMLILPISMGMGGYYHHCGEDEEYKECGNLCNKTCANLENNRTCTDVCVEGCFCKDGLVKNNKGRCVRPCDCPHHPCGPNEVYVQCGTACPRTCANLNKPPICPKKCVSGCFCVNGLVRNDKGQCVNPCDCPHEPCGEGEVFNCCGSKCPRTCANLGNKTILCPAGCVRGCFCKDGLVRNDHGKCVNPNQCPHPCGPDEVFDPCGTACPKTCANLNKKLSCPGVCVPGCFCKEGLVRDNNGKCVKPCDCPHVCPPNEVYNPCGTACPRTCDNLDEPINCPKNCVKGCFCKDGWVRNKLGICVNPNECPHVCPPDEVYNPCGTACPRTCDNLGEPINCPKNCVKGCFCKDGWVRNKLGKCVRPCDCPHECGPNEVYDKCGTACPKTCSNLYKEVSCPGVCVEGCFCKDGLVRNDDKKCVKPCDCFNGTTYCSVGKNEYYICPMKNAVCCPDGESCCPPNTECCEDKKCTIVKEYQEDREGTYQEDSSREDSFREDSSKEDFSGEDSSWEESFWEESSWEDSL